MILILLPHTDAERARHVGERVRAAVAAHPLAVGSGPYGNGLHVTCSIGAAACPPQPAVRDDLVAAADHALYAAKRLGRNQVRGAGDLASLPLAKSTEPTPSASLRYPLSMQTLTQLHVYPVKSLGGIGLAQSDVCARGLRHDRRWMVVDPDGRFLTQREFPRHGAGPPRPRRRRPHAGRARKCPPCKCRLCRHRLSL